MRDRFLVCGLGSLGQHCVNALKGFGVEVVGIDRKVPLDWEARTQPDDIVLGDCRYAEILERAEIRQCRAVLIVTSNDNVNIQAALAVRAIAPRIRLVIRSSKQNLNELLSSQLGNFAAFEASLLAANVFALAALEEETVGFFNLEGKLMRVVKHCIQPGEGLDNCPLSELNRGDRRILCHLPAGSVVPIQFHQWDPNATAAVGDELVYLEVSDRKPDAILKAGRSEGRWQQLWQDLHRGTWEEWQQQLQELFSQQENQVGRVAVVALLTLLTLLFLGTVMLRLSYPNIMAALNATFILLLGGYPDVVGVEPKLPHWMLFLSLMVAIGGTALVGVLYALLTEQLLTSRFQFLKRRPAIPQRDHLVLIGLGRVGQGVAAWLQEFGQPVVCISPTPVEPDVVPQLPLVTGKPARALALANLLHAKSAIAVTDDEMQNLELGLTIQAANPNVGLVIRTYSQIFSDSLAQLLPSAQVLCAYAIAAEVFAGAAFGEQIDYLFHLGQETALVAEYRISAEDNLHGLLLAEIAYGYGVLPLLLQKSGNPKPTWIPSDDLRAEEGDRLVVLATIEGLQRIERGDCFARYYFIGVEEASVEEAAFEGANAIARIAGCNLSQAKLVMERLPAQLPVPLYPQQAERLVRHLKRVRVKAHVIPPRDRHS